MEQSSEYWTPAEAATELRISLGTLYSLMRDGRVPCNRVGTQWRISRRDLGVAVDQGRLATSGRQQP